MSSDKRRVQFRASEKLIGRADPLATVLGTDRTDVLTDALREYLRDAAHDDRLTRKTTTESFRTVEMLVGPREAASVRVLKHHLDDLVLRLSAHARDADTDRVDTCGRRGAFRWGEHLRTGRPKVGTTSVRQLVQAHGQKPAAIR